MEKEGTGERDSVVVVVLMMMVVVVIQGVTVFSPIRYG